jgi:hypothetical protein
MKEPHMSGDDLPEFRIGPIGPMYVYDLLDYLSQRNATSLGSALALIEATRRYGPAIAGAVQIAEGVFEARVHIGYGLNAVIEFERDRAGTLQPVVGEVVKL